MKNPQIVLERIIDVNNILVGFYHLEEKKQKEESIPVGVILSETITEVGLFLDDCPKDPLFALLFNEEMYDIFDWYRTITQSIYLAFTQPGSLDERLCHTAENLVLLVKSEEDDQA